MASFCPLSEAACGGSRMELFKKSCPTNLIGQVITELGADVWGDKTVWVRRGLSVGFLQGTNWTKVSRSGGSHVAARSDGAQARRRCLVVCGRALVGCRWAARRWPMHSRTYPAFMDPNRLLEDGAGNVWIGTDRQGLVRLSADDSIARYFTGTGFPTDHVTCLLEDREANVWVGGNKGGLMRISRRNFFTPRSMAGLPSTSPLCVAADPGSGMWVGFAEAGLHQIVRRQSIGTSGGARPIRLGSASVPRRTGMVWRVWPRTGLAWKGESADVVR